MAKSGANVGEKNESGARIVLKCVKSALFFSYLPPEYGKIGFLRTKAVPEKEPASVQSNCQ